MPSDVICARSSCSKRNRHAATIHASLYCVHTLVCCIGYGDCAERRLQRCCKPEYYFLRCHGHGTSDAGFCPIEDGVRRSLVTREGCDQEDCPHKSFIAHDQFLGKALKVWGALPKIG